MVPPARHYCADAYIIGRHGGGTLRRITGTALSASTASLVGKDRVVFNIHGNKYRLIIRYRPPVVFIRFVGTHAEYDRIDVTTI